MNIGIAIKVIREERGLSQQELADKCKIAQTSISQIESGWKRPHESTMKKICKVLDTNPMMIYLMTLELSDVPEKKKAVYKMLFPIVKDMLLKIIK